MKIVYYFNKKRLEKEKIVVQSIYGEDVLFIDENPLYVLDMFENGDFLICSSIDDLLEDTSLVSVEDMIKAYMSILGKGVELLFDKSTQCNSLFIKTLITDEEEFEPTLRKCIANYQNQRQVESKYARQHAIIARANGNRVGLRQGTKLVTKKSVEMKKRITELSKDFTGTLNDEEVMNVLKIARNSYYKYKKELREEVK